MLLLILFFFSRFLPGVAQETFTAKENIQAFMDSVIAAQMASWPSPGVAYAIVKDGEIFSKKEYGYADIEKRIPVSADTTVFRIASVSKVFTATGVMQLYERGLINLEEDVNTYLKKFKIENAYNRPVTVANLLTHTAGFDDRHIERKKLEESDVLPLGKYLASRMPPRSMPPGEVFSYSNHGMALAGYLIEEIGEESFATYMDEYIFRPLDMNSSSFERHNIVTNLATGYKHEDGVYLAQPFEYIQTVPASMMMSTVTDVARFMRAHLEDRPFLERRIIGEVTLRKMHTQQFTHSPGISGTAFGFHESFRNGLRLLDHGGTTAGFGSYLYLIPEKKLGIFVAHNGDGEYFAKQIITKLLDHLFPYEYAEPQPMKILDSNLARFTGSYVSTRHARKLIEKINILFMNKARVRMIGENTLEIWGTSAVQVKPQLFQWQDKNIKASAREIAFREDQDGNITHLFYDGGAYEKLRWYETGIFQLIFFIFPTLVFLYVTIGWSIKFASNAIKRKRETKKKNESFDRIRQRANAVVFLICALNTFFIIGFSAIMMTQRDALVYHLPVTIYMLLIIPLITTVLTVLMIFYNIKIFGNKGFSAVKRFYYLSMTTASLTFIWLLNYWNILGFKV